MNAEQPKALGKVLLSLPREKYDALPGLNFSRLKVLGRSPAHFNHATLHPEKERSDTLVAGIATHTATFEPEAFAEQFAIWDGGRRYGKEWDKFCAENAEREALTEQQADDARTIAKAVRSDATAAKYVSGGRAEVSLTWTRVLSEFAGTPEMRIACKARLDFVSSAEFLVDLKTTKDASPDAFGRQCVNLDYLGQAAWYADGYEAATGKRLPFVIVAVEKTAPHVVQVYRLPEDVLQVGRDRCNALVQRYALCRAESRWPGYAADGAELNLTLPRWAVPHEDENLDGLDLVFGSDDAA